MNIRMITPVFLALALSACAPQPETTRGSMSMPSQLPTLDASSALGAETVMQSQYDVQQVIVSVPRKLQVSEANTFLPAADIVWRGDVLGDRHQQVQAIVQDAMMRGTASMHRGPKVVVEVEITRFHALTEKTRFTVGGTHSMHFLLTVRDAETGAILAPTRLVNADVKASGGAKAMAEDAAGRTQKVVVTERLAQVIRRELSVPVQNLAPDMLVSRFDGTPVRLSFIE